MLVVPSVPIVSQTEIDPMKTALSLMLALATTTALTEPLPVPKARAGRLVPARLHRERLILHAVTGCFGRHRSNGTCPWDGLRRARTACEMDARGSSLRAGSIFQSPEFRTPPCLRILGTAVDRCMNSAGRQSRSPATKPLANGRRISSSA
jgi:hypothetical protein